MKPTEIETLLERYFDGETTLEEEQILRDLFTSDAVPPHLASYRTLFAGLARERNLTLDDPTFELQTAEAMTGSARPAAAPVVRFRHRNALITGLAASVLLLAGLFLTFRQEIPRLARNRPADPAVERAWTDASRALLLLSGNFNHGLEQARRLQTVERVIQDLSHFNKFYQYQTLIINPDDLDGMSKK